MTPPVLPGLRFGVEIEFKGLTLERASEVLTSKNVEAPFITGRIHTTTKTWKVVKDLSVTTFDGGGEVVSPILQGEAGLAQVAKVLDILKNSGAYVDKKCGVHVHVDASSFEEHELIHMMERYLDNEEEIGLFVNHTRRQNCYCLPIRGHHRCVHMLRRGGYTLRRLRNYFPRDLTVNIHSLVRHGTIEFRQHAGSLEAKEVCPWIRWCLHFMEASRHSKIEGLQSTYFHPEDTTTMLEFLEQPWVDEGGRRYNYIDSMARNLGWPAFEVRDFVYKMRDYGFPFLSWDRYVEIANTQLFNEMVLELWEQCSISRAASPPLTHWSTGMPPVLTHHFQGLMARNA